jgi:hypothetical protein
MEIKATNCNDCPFGHIEWDLEYDYFWLKCGLEQDGQQSIKHNGDINHMGKRKFKAPKDCKLKEAKEITVKLT